MPRILENDAYSLAQSLETMDETQRAQALDILTRYRDQQSDLGEPQWPTQDKAAQDYTNRLRGMFKDIKTVDSVAPSLTAILPYSQNPDADRARVANTAYMAQRYGKTPEEISASYDLYRNDYAQRFLQAPTGLDDLGFHKAAAQEIQKTELKEGAELDGIKAAFRGDDVVPALQAWQAKNADRLPDSSEFTRGFLKARETSGDHLEFADKLLKQIEGNIGLTKSNGEKSDKPSLPEAYAQFEESLATLADMKPKDRKQVYAIMRAKAEAAGYDLKGFWSQMLSELGKGLDRATSTLSTQAGITADVVSKFPEMLTNTMKEGDFKATDASIARRQGIGEVYDELTSLVAGSVDPVKPVLGWMNDTVETGLIKGPGAVAPFMMASAALGPYGAGALFTADFAEQNRRDLRAQGMDNDKAMAIGAAAAPLQAITESLSNALQLGRFPAVQKVLAGFTKPIGGGAGLITRYVQNSAISLGTEFTEEQLQDNFIVPATQELLGALQSDIPDVDWSMYRNRAVESTPELLSVLAPMALVFGGTMTAAQANLSSAVISSQDMLEAAGYSAAQANAIRNEATPETQISKAREFWSARAGTPQSIEDAAKSVGERMKQLQTDHMAAQLDMERRGILPRMLRSSEDNWRLTFSDGSTADFHTHQDADAARWQWATDQLGKVHLATREALAQMEKNAAVGREFAVEFKPDAMTAKQAVEEGRATPAQIDRRIAQGEAAGEVSEEETFSSAASIDKATSDYLSSLQILGSSANEFKDGVLRTTIRLYEGAHVLTLVEEKLEGDAKQILASKPGSEWMLRSLRNYEQISGDSILRKVPDAELTQDDLIEAWSSLGQSYLVGKSKKGAAIGKGGARRIFADVLKAGMGGAMNSETQFFNAVWRRAAKLSKLKREGKLGDDLTSELERQLGIDSQAKHETEAAKEADAIANEALNVGGTSYSEENPGPNGETFSLQNAEPSPGGLSEAEVEIKAMLPTDVRADYQKFDDRAPILWRGETSFPAVRSVKIIGADSSGKSRSIYPSAAVTLSNGGVFVKRFRVSDHGQVSETAFRQYDLDYRLTRERGESEKAFDKRILQAAEDDLISSARIAWEDQMKQLRPLIDANYGTALQLNQLQERQKREVELQRDYTMRFFRDDSMRPAKVYRNKFGWAYQNGNLTDAQGNELGIFANLDEARFWIRDTYFEPSRAEGGTLSLRKFDFSSRLGPAAETLRSMRQAGKAVDFPAIYKAASVGQSSSMLSLDRLFNEAQKQNTALTEAEFGKQIQALYDSGSLMLEPGESPDAMKEALARFGVRDSLGIPSMFAAPMPIQETFSIRSGDFSSRMAAAFSPFQRNPELRMVIAQVAKARAQRLGADWIEKAAVIRRFSDLEREAKTREALKSDELVASGMQEKDARKEAKRQSAEWLTEAKKKAGSPKAQREMLKAALRTLDGILSAAPPEVRAKVGGYVKLAGLATDEAMLQEIERRIEKLNVELEKWLKKEGTAEIEKLFKKARPDSTSGKKDKGKDADMHALFASAEKASKMDETTVSGELARLDALIGSDTLTPEQEALATTERGLVELLGDLKHADSGRVFSALDTLRDIYDGAWLKWKLAQIDKREERASMREAFITDTGKRGLKPERDAADKAAATLLGKIKGGFLSLSSFHEVLSYAFGEKSDRVKSLVDAEREAAGQYEDVNQALADEVEGLFAEMAGGSVLAGERLRYDMAQRTIKTAKGELSQLEAIQALLMWRQDDGRRHMEGPLGDDGKPIGAWHYDQAWIDEITAALTPEARRVMAWLSQKYAAEHPALNRLYRQRYGVNMPAHDNYAPITVQPVQTKSGEVNDPVSGAAISSGSILTPGSLRTRSRSAIAEPDFRDALQTFMAHTRQLEYWKAYYNLAVEANAILGNREVLNAVKAKGGEQAATALRKWVDAIAQGGFRDASATLGMHQLLSRMTGRAATVGLLGRVSTLLVQSTQLAAASVKMPVGAFLKRFSRLMTGNLGWGDAINSPFIQRRYKSAPPIVRQAIAQLGTASRPNQITRATRALGQLLSGADALFTAGTYALLLDYHRGTGRALGLTGAELEQHAHSEAERDTEQVAQPTRMATRSLAELTSTNPIAKVSWAYASEARQKIALAAWAATKATTEPAQFAKTVFLVFGVGGLMTQVLKNLWREAKGDDDEKKWSAERLALSALAGPLHGIPLASELMGNGGMLSGFVWSKSAATNILEGEGDLRDVDTLLSAAGYFNDTAAGVAALSHAGLDFAKLLSNLSE